LVEVVSVDCYRFWQAFNAKLPDNPAINQSVWRRVQAFVLYVIVAHCKDIYSISLIIK
jgi:hypothetical protein